MRWCYLITFLLIGVSAVYAQPDVMPVADSADTMKRSEVLIMLTDGSQFFGIGLSWTNDTLSVQNWHPTRESLWKNEPRRFPATQIAAVETTSLPSSSARHAKGMGGILHHGWMLGGAMMIMMVAMVVGGLH